MPARTFQTQLPTTPADLYAWHARPGAFQRLNPPWEEVRIEEPAPIENGSQVLLRLKKGPVWLRWVAEHRDVETGSGFTDVQVEGPFARWEHRHEFEATADGQTLLTDRLEYELPGYFLGRWVAGGAVAKDLERMFAYRHATTARDLARHREFADRGQLRIAVTGASGLVGTALSSFLSTGGHSPVPLTRAVSQRRSPGASQWDPRTGLLNPEALAPVDAIVHLAGENVAGGRWTAARKAAIRDSRVLGTRNLVKTLERLNPRPKTLVCASAIGFYGSRANERLDESSASGAGFLAETSQEWEAAALAAERLGMRVILLRFGIVLSPAGGALAKMLTPFRVGVGGVLGSGDQYMSWISIDDAVGAIHQALVDTRLAGPVNVVAPQPATNRQFTEALGRVLGRPTILPLPAAGTRLAFGEMADEMLLASARVFPKKLESVGFRFDDSDLDTAFARLLGKVEWS